MKVLFTVCGRAGSKGIKNKNISTFLGNPIPYYTISALDLFLKRTSIPIEWDAVVSSDSEALVEMLVNNPKIKMQSIARDASLSGDAVGKIDVINNCREIMEERNGYTYDVVVDLDITSPLRTANDIERVIKTHIETGADVTTTVAPARRNPYFNQVKRGEHGFEKVIASNFTARQQAPEIFDMNASIYAYSPAFLKSNKGLFSGYVECIEMFDTGILDLDHKGDFELMEVIAKFLFETKPEFGEIVENI